jgi:hypothetical protein
MSHIRVKEKYTQYVYLLECIRNAYIGLLCKMPRDRFSASNIGTFACRAFPRDTKASKRANLSNHDIYKSDQELREI